MADMAEQDFDEKKEEAVAVQPLKKTILIATDCFLPIC